MNQLNQIILEGNIVRAPESRTTANGSHLAAFSVAVNRYMKRADGNFEQEVSYFDVESWGRTAELVAGKAGRGTGCRIVGRLRQDRWKGSDGRSCSRVSVVAEHIDLLPGHAEAGQPEEAPAQEKPPVAKKPAKFDRSRLFHAPESAQESGPVAEAAGPDIF